MKTNRGFELQHLIDDYGVEYDLQESSSCEPHIWLGINRPKLMIMYKDARAIGLDLKKNDPETNEWGWCDFPVPKEVLIESRIHLNREQAKDLAKRLNYFARHGYLNEERVL